MLGRLLIGIVKGLIVGGLLGFGLAKLGLAAPGAVVAYIAAAVAGVLVGLIAGKPIWAKDAKIEAGAKAFVGALLAAGLMWAARRWLTMQVPLSLGPLAAPNASLDEAVGTAGTFGGLAITSLAAVAAILGGFYEADNTPEPEDEGARAKASAKTPEAKGTKRIASTAAVDDEFEGELDGEADKKRAKK